jgi:hypothetical protein
MDSVAKRKFCPCQSRHGHCGEEKILPLPEPAWTARRRENACPCQSRHGQRGEEKILALARAGMDSAAKRKFLPLPKI